MKRLFDKLVGTKLEDYIPKQSVPQLEIIDLSEGDGQACPPDATVTVHYTGARAIDGIIFESSKDRMRPISFKLDEVIQGWQEGLPGMKVGGTRRLLIPSEKAYKSHSPSKAIPPHSDLVFDIELLDVK